MRGMVPGQRPRPNIGHPQARTAAKWRPGPGHHPATVTRRAIRVLARRWLDLTDEINTHNRELDELVQLAAPNLVAE